MDSKILDLNEQTRQGLNLCPTCGQPKEMYYVPWCPRCDKPTLDGRELNFVQAITHIEAIGNPGYKDRLWDGLLDEITGNDTAFLLSFSPDDNPDLKLLQQTFNLGDSVLMWVSW